MNGTEKQFRELHSFNEWWLDKGLLALGFGMKKTTSSSGNAGSRTGLEVRLVIVGHTFVRVCMGQVRIIKLRVNSLLGAFGLNHY